MCMLDYPTTDKTDCDLVVRIRAVRKGLEGEPGRRAQR